MRTRGAQTFPDFNPSLRNPGDFGYSVVRDALHNVFQAFSLTTPLTYPRALDTSHWTCENIQDWQAVAQTIVLQYNKSTEGYSFQDIDSQLATLEGKTAGLISLFYHFFRRNLNGTSQWNYFKNKTENLILQIGGNKIAIIDMETTDGVPNSSGNLNFKLFCNSAHADGYKVGLYVNPAQWVSFGLGSWVNEFVDFYIIAHWQAGNNPDRPAGIDPAKIAMQQEGVLGLHSWIQPIPGLIPQMDANLLLWPLAQWETFTGQKYTPGGIEPPPPDPEPIGEFMYTADVIYLAPGTTYRNMRSKPDSIAPDIGIDVGDVVITDKKLPVYEVLENSEGTWLHLKKGNTVGWVLGKANGVTYLKLTPLVPMLQVKAAVDKVPLWYWKDKNGQNKPIMVKPDSASKFFFGATFLVDPVKIDADGDNDFYKVLNPFNASPPAITPPAGFTGWYCKVSEAVPL